MFPAAAAALIALAAAVPFTGSVEGPQPGHTGGFGEPTCTSCHFDGELNSPGASVRLEGLPPKWRPGTTAEFAVVLRASPLQRGGFQLAARYLDGQSAGRQAGVIQAVSSGTLVTESAGIQYAHHTVDGTSASGNGVMQWILRWTAPADVTDSRIVFHVSANAANDDNSEFGDRIVTSADTLAAHAVEFSPARWPGDGDRPHR